MNNNQFPPLEPEKDLPEILPDIPERMEPLEELPVIEELTFTQEEPAEELYVEDLEEGGREK